MTEVQRLAKIMVLKDMRKEYELRAKYNGGVDYDCYRALDMAINALEQEPCGDAISREDALQALCKAVHKNDDTIPCLNQRVSCLWDKTKVQDYAEEILKLPPVTPAEKVGHWIYDDDCREHGHCSKCGYGSIDLADGKPHNYCSNCGCKMVDMEKDNTPYDEFGFFDPFNFRKDGEQNEQS